MDTGGLASQVGAVPRTTVIHTKKRIINESERTGTCYSYDAIGNLTNVLPATYSVLDGSYQAVTNAESVSYSYNAQNRLDEIATESTVYPFSYDVYDKLDNLKEVWYTDNYQGNNTAWSQAYEYTYGDFGTNTCAYIANSSSC